MDEMCQFTENLGLTNTEEYEKSDERPTINNVVKVKMPVGVKETQKVKSKGFLFQTNRLE